MMKLVVQAVDRWPRLAWLATFEQGSRIIEVRHGPSVEACDQWCVEAAWAGEFADGDFDRTDLVFGSGIRCRQDRVWFVSPGTAMDRLFYCSRGRRWYVSNSLAALCTAADLTLLDTDAYANDRFSRIGTTWGAETCTRTFPTTSGDANVIWFNNLVYDGQSLVESAKPDAAPAFQSYGDYKAFLVDTAGKLRNNIASPRRRCPPSVLASVSSGYDSPAAAVVALHAGCTEAVTIEQAASIWRGSDSGVDIARRLGLSCRVYPRTARQYPNEAAFWAGSGYANLLNWTLFDYPRSPCLFFTGNYGDAIWARVHRHSPFTIDIWDDLAMGEYRLLAGMWQCIVPFWGMRHWRQIEEITFSPEMAPWTLHSSYDRPIARRLVEEAGVPRGAFAVRKKNSSHESAFRWPYSPDAQASFRAFLRKRGKPAPGSLAVRLFRGLSLAEALVYANVTNRLDIRRRFRPWMKLDGTAMLVQWGVEELKTIYRAGMNGASGLAGATGEADPG